VSENRMAGHPDDTVTASYLDGTLEGQSLERFESHLAECDLCRDGIALLRSAEGGAQQVPPEFLRRARTSPPRRGWMPRGRLLLGVAASFLLIAAITAGVLRLGSPERQAPSPVRGSSPTFTELSPSGDTLLPPSHVWFRWSPVEGADRYELSVFDTAGTQVAQALLGAEETSTPWPADAPPPAPGQYLWKIRAMALDRVVAESGPTPFEVGP